MPSALRLVRLCRWLWAGIAGADVHAGLECIEINLSWLWCVMPIMLRLEVTVCLSVKDAAACTTQHSVGIARSHAITAQRRRVGAYMFNLLLIKPLIKALRRTLRMLHVGIARLHASTAQRRCSGAHKFKLLPSEP